jgi:hypothetical protein
MNRESETPESKEPRLVAARRWSKQFDKEVNSAVGISPGAFRNFREIIRLDTRTAQLLSIIDSAGWEGLYLWQLESASRAPLVWDGKAQDLAKALSTSTMSKEAERLLKFNKIERLLSRLKEDEPDRVAQHRTGTEGRWRISAPCASGACVAGDST